MVLKSEIIKYDNDGWESNYKAPDAEIFLTFAKVKILSSTTSCTDTNCYISLIINNINLYWSWYQVILVRCQSFVYFNIRMSKFSVSEIIRTWVSVKSQQRNVSVANIYPHLLEIQQPFHNGIQADIMEVVEISFAEFRLEDVKQQAAEKSNKHDKLYASVDLMVWDRH